MLRTIGLEPAVAAEAAPARQGDFPVHTIEEIRMVIDASSAG